MTDKKALRANVSARTRTRKDTRTRTRTHTHTTETKRAAKSAKIGIDMLTAKGPIFQRAKAN